MKSEDLEDFLENFDPDKKFPKAPLTMIPHMLGCVCRGFIAARTEMCPVCALGLSTHLEEVNRNLESFLEKSVEEFIDDEKQDGYDEEWTPAQKLALMRAYEAVWPKFQIRFDADRSMERFIAGKIALDLGKSLMDRLRGRRT